MLRYDDADEEEEFASLGAALPALRVLALAGMHADLIPAAVWRRLFSSLPAVHTQRLVWCHHVHVLLPLLAECAPPLLRALHFQRHRYNVCKEPSAHAVQALQHALPQLHIEID